MPANHLDLKQKLYDDLQRLLWAMTWDLANDNRWQLEPDEIFAELCLELVKTAEKYAGKPYTEIKSLVVVCCRHRVCDLADMNYNTHRKAEATAVSLDAPVTSRQGNGDDFEIEVGTVDTYFDADDFKAGLSSDAQRLVDEVLHPSDRAQQLFELSLARKRAVAVNSSWYFELTPRLLQRSLGWPEYRLNSAWNEVVQAVQSL